MQRQHIKLYQDTEYNQIIQTLQRYHTNGQQDVVLGLLLEQGVSECTDADGK
jgi:hypothetical protein